MPFSLSDNGNYFVIRVESQQKNVSAQQSAKKQLSRLKPCRKWHETFFPPQWHGPAKAGHTDARVAFEFWQGMIINEA